MLVAVYETMSVLWSLHQITLIYSSRYPFFVDLLNKVSVDVQEGTQIHRNSRDIYVFVGYLPFYGNL